MRRAEGCLSWLNLPTSHPYFPIVELHFSRLKAGIKEWVNNWILFIPEHFKCTKAKKFLPVVPLSSPELFSNDIRGVVLSSLGSLLKNFLCLYWDQEIQRDQANRAAIYIDKEDFDALLRMGQHYHVNSLLLSALFSWGRWRFLRMENSSAFHFKCNNSRRTP